MASSGNASEEFVRRVDTLLPLDLQFTVSVELSSEHAFVRQPARVRQTSPRASDTWPSLARRMPAPHGVAHNARESLSPLRDKEVAMPRWRRRNVIAEMRAGRTGGGP